MSPLPTGPAWLRAYGLVLRGLAVAPAATFDAIARGRIDLEPRPFCRLTGFLLSALFFLFEALTGGKITWPLLLAAALALLALPFLLEAVVVLGAAFTGLASQMLGEPLDAIAVRKVWCFSMAGLLPLSFGGGPLVLLSFWVVVLQVVGLERLLPCSRFKAAVLAGFPLLLLTTLAFMFAVIFKTRVF